MGGDIRLQLDREIKLLNRFLCGGWRKGAKDQGYEKPLCPP